jgi:hypothetical protein
MKAWKLGLVAAAMSSMAFAAGTPTTGNATTSTDANVTSSGSTMAGGMPAECAKLTGRALSDCVRDHTPSSTRSKSGVNNPADTDANRGTANRLKNDKSGSTSGTTGGNSNAGQTGASGSNSGGMGTSGASGTSGTSGTSGDTGGSGTGGGK